MIAYFDSSSIVKWFFDEPQMDRARKTKDQSEIAITSPLSFPEVMSAICRAKSEKRCSGYDVKLVKEEFLSVWPNFQLVQINDSLIQLSGKLVFTHGLKGYDSVHLASALALKKSEKGIKIFFSCFDEKLNKAAKKEGLAIH